MKKLYAMLVVLAAGSGLLAATGCSRELPAPAQTVQSVLELRARNSTDVAGYKPFFEESSVASALADASASEPSKTPVPEWRRPTVESSSDTSAVVIVEWETVGEFKSWPKRTTFVLKKAGDRWVIVDAEESGSPETTGSSDASKTP